MIDDKKVQQMIMELRILVWALEHGRGHGFADLEKHIRTYYEHQ